LKVLFPPLRHDMLLPFYSYLVPHPPWLTFSYSLPTKPLDLTKKNPLSRAQNFPRWTALATPFCLRAFALDKEHSAPLCLSFLLGSPSPTFFGGVYGGLWGSTVLPPHSGEDVALLRFFFPLCYSWDVFCIGSFLRFIRSALVFLLNRKILLRS